MQGRAVVLALVVLALLGGGYLLSQAGPLPGLNVPLPGPRRAPEATENFLKGQQNFNAELVWNSYSDEGLDRLRARGVTPQVYVRQFELAKQAGVRLENFNYVGGYSLPDGSSLQFYVVASRGPTRPDVEYVTYIFTLDRSGKISKVQ
jgi:hypothetical protein